MTAKVRFCARCGASLADSAAAGLCARCHARRAPAARILVGCLIRHADRLLWIRRALDPRRGFWSIPAGFLECGETTAHAAARELYEEVGLRVPDGAWRLHGLGSVRRMSEVYVVYRAAVEDPRLSLGDEVLEARFFRESELPWADIAFPEINYLVRLTYADIRRGKHGVYLADHERGAFVEQGEFDPRA